MASNPVNVNVLRECYKESLDTVLRYRGFPFYGTLLGLTRAGDLISGDDDVDFWINLEFRDYAISSMLASGFTVDWKLPWNRVSDYFIQFKKEFPDGVGKVDFYLFEMSQTGKFCIERWNFLGRPKDEDCELRVPEHLIFPLHIKNILDYEVLIPHNPHYICEFLYGKGWREPQKKGVDYKIEITDGKPVLFFASGTKSNL
jgi:hypothetical protein